ncbi:MAG: hypothetical protein ACRDRJ_04990 [Streptosporangiaceae bacterium]
MPVSAGMIVAVPAGLLASPLRNGRDPGDSDRSALVIGGTEKIRTGGRTVFLKVVAVTEAVVTRGGQVRAGGARMATRRSARWRTGWTRRPVRE